MDSTKSTIDNDQISRAAAALLQADGIVITAGAGMGVDSGLPDFRGREGFWRTYPALAASHTSFEEIANPSSFMFNPRIGWGFYGNRLTLYRNTVPHEGFSILKEWDNLCPNGAFVVTSNVDGQFQKASFAANSIWEMHGSIHHLQCTEPCDYNLTWDAKAFEPVIDEASLQLTGRIPHCLKCGEVARPNVLMFDDFKWVHQRENGQRLLLEDWLSTVNKIVVVELGAGTTIQSIRRQGEHLANRNNNTLIRINAREADVDKKNHIGIAGKCVEVLRMIHAKVLRELNQVY